MKMNGRKTKFYRKDRVHQLLSAAVLAAISTCCWSPAQSVYASREVDTDTTVTENSDDFSNNVSASNGGAFRINNGVSLVFLANAVLNDNTAVSGGAVYRNGNGTKLTFGSGFETYEIEFSRNSAQGGNGGAICLCNNTTSQNTLEIKKNTSVNFRSNSAGESGGAVYFTGYSKDSFVVEESGNVVFDSNTAGKDGGAVSFAGMVNDCEFKLLAPVTFKNNSAVRGGAVYVSNSVAEIKGGIFYANTAFASGSDAAKSGEALFAGNGCNLTLTDCVFFANKSSATDESVNGALVFAGNSAKVYLTGQNKFFDNDGWDILNFVNGGQISFGDDSLTYLNDGLCLSSGNSVSATVSGVVHSKNVTLGGETVLTVKAGGILDNAYFDVDGTGESAVLGNVVAGYGVTKMTDNANLTVETGGIAVLNNISFTGNTVLNHGTMTLQNGSYAGRYIMNSGVLKLINVDLQHHSGLAGSVLSNTGTVYFYGGTLGIDVNDSFKKVGIVHVGTNGTISQLDLSGCTNTIYAQSFIIDSGATLKVGSATKLEVDGTITNYGTLNAIQPFVLSSSAGFVNDSGNVTASGLGVDSVPYEVIKNSASSFQGVKVYNGAGSSISQVTFTSGTDNLRSMVFAGSGLQGGLVFNAGTIADISGGIRFTLNTSSSFGNDWTEGAFVYNSGTVTSVGGKFLGTVYRKAGYVSGGIFFNSGTVGLIGESVWSNNGSALGDFDGGGLYNSGEITQPLSQATFTDNTASSVNGAVRGGGIFNSGNLSGGVTGGTYSHNVVWSDGGNVYGGSIYNTGTISALSGFTFSSNTARTTATGNQSAAGGALWTNTEISGGIKNVSFDYNAAYAVGGSACGGGIYTTSVQTIQAQNSDLGFSYNTASADASAGRAFGGAIYSSADLTLNAFGGNISFEGNYVTGSVAKGSAIYLDGEVNLKLNAAAGKKISFGYGQNVEDSGSAATIITGAGAVELKGGTIATSKVTISEDTSFVLNSGMVSSVVTNLGTFNIDGGTLGGKVLNSLEKAQLNLLSGNYTGDFDNLQGTMTISSSAYMKGVLANNAIVNVVNFGSSFGDTSTIVNNESGEMNVQGGNISRVITNNGTLNMQGSRIDADVTGTGILNIKNTLTSAANIGNSVTVALSTGDLTVNAGTISGASVTVNGKLTVSGMYSNIRSEVTNFGTVNVSAGAVSGKVFNRSGGDYKVDNGNHSGALTNEGTLTVSGGTFSSVTNKADMVINKIGRGYGAVFETGINNNGGKITLKSGTLDCSIIGMNGRVLVDGSITSKDIISCTGGLTIKENGSLYIPADKVKTNVEIVVNANMSVTGSENNAQFLNFSVSVQGEGKLHVSKYVNVTSEISSPIMVENDGYLKIGVANIGADITNNGTILFANEIEETLTHPLGGKVVVAGHVANSSNNSLSCNELIIEEGGELKTDGNDFGCSGVKNSGIISVTGGTLNSCVTAVGAKGKIVVTGAVKLNTNESCPIEIGPGGVLSANLSYAGSGIKLNGTCTTDTTTGRMTVTDGKDAVLKISSNYSYNYAVGGVGTINFENDAVLAEGTEFEPVLTVASKPVSGISLVLKDGVRLGFNDIQPGVNTGALQNITMGNNATIDMSGFGTLAATKIVLTGNFDAGSSANLAMDILSDNDMDMLEIRGNATGNLHLDINVPNELLKIGDISVIDPEDGKAYYGYVKGGSNVYLDANGYVAKNKADRVSLDGGFNYAGAGGEGLTLWKDIPIGGNDNLVMNITTKGAGVTSSGIYLYTFTYEPNSDVGNDNQLKIVKTLGFLNLPKTIQAFISNSGTASEYNAANVQTYSINNDYHNVMTVVNGGVTESVDGGGKDLGILTRVEKGAGYIGGGQTGGDTHRTLNLNFNGHGLDGAGWKGITVQDGDTLKFTDVTVIDNFADGKLATNDGTIVFSKGNLTLSAGIVDSSGSGTAGTVEIDGANVTVSATEQHQSAGAWYFKGDDNTYGNSSVGGDTIAKTAAQPLAFKQSLLKIKSGSFKILPEQLGFAAIVNDGKLILQNKDSNSVTFAQEITGLGELVIDVEDLIITAAVTNKITVNATGQLSVAPANIGADVKNNGTVVFDTAGILAHKLEGGTLKINADLSVLADNLAADDSVIGTGMTLTLTGGTLSGKVSGSGDLMIDGAVTAKAALAGNVTVSTGQTLTADACYVQSNISNNGTVELTGTDDITGLLEKSVTGGNVMIKGYVLSDVGNLLADELSVDSGCTLALTGDDITGKLNKSVDGDGKLKIVGTVIPGTGVKISTSGGILIDNGGKLVTESDQVETDVTNNGTLELAGGTFSHAISGTGTLKLNSDFVVGEDNPIAETQTVVVSTGKTFSTGGNLHGLAGITLGVDSVFDLQNNVVETVNVGVFIAGSNLSGVKLDVDLANGSNDKIVISSGSGMIGIGDYTPTVRGINILGELPGDIGATTTVTLFEGALTGLSFVDKVASQLGIYRYVFEETAVAGTYSVLKEYAKSLKEVINCSDYDSSLVSSYAFAKDYVADADLGYLTRTDAGGADRTGGSTARDVSVDVRGYAYKGDGHKGITVNSGDTLNLKNTSGISGWNEYAFKNAGTLNFTNVALLDSAITGENGRLTVSGNMTVGAAGSIVQQEMAIDNGKMTLVEGAALSVGTLSGNGSLVSDVNLEFNAETLQLTGGIENKKQLLLRGGSDGNYALVVPKVTGSGNILIDNGSFIEADVAKIGQNVTNSGKFSLTGTGTFNGVVTGKGDLLVTGQVKSKSITATNVNIADGGSLSVTDGAVLTATAVEINDGSLLLSKSNVFKDDFSLPSSPLIGNITGDKGVITVDVDGEEYSATVCAEARQQLFGSVTGPIDLVLTGGKLKISDTGSKAKESVVVAGTLSNNVITVQGEGATVVTTANSSLAAGTRLMEVDATDDNSISVLKTRTVKITKNLSATSVDSALQSVDGVVFMKKTDTVSGRSVNSTVFAKDLQIQGTATAGGTVTLTVGSDSTDNSELNLAGTRIGLVKDKDDNAVPVAIVVKDGAKLNLGDQSRTKTGSCGNLVSLAVDGAVNVYETCLKIGKLTGSGGMLYIDPSYVEISDVTGAGNTVLQVDGDGGVLNLGSRWNAEELSQMAKKFGFGVRMETNGDEITGFTLKSDGVLLAVGEPVSLGTGALIASSTKYDKTAVGIHFDGSSVIIADGAGAYGGGLISGVKTAPEIGSGSVLYICDGNGYQFTEGDSLTILVGSGVTDAGTYWQADSVVLSDSSYDVDVVTVANNKYSVLITTATDHSVMPAVVKAMKDGGHNDFFTTLRLNSRGKGTKSYTNAENALANFGEAGGVQHGVFSIAGQIGDIICGSMGIISRPISHRDRFNIVNTVSDIRDYDVAVVESGEAGSIMPQSKSYVVKEGKQVWATYLRNKENITGLSLGGISADYTAKYNGIVAGADLRVAEKSVLGLALTYSEGDMSGFTGGVSTHNDAEYYGISLYNRIAYNEAVCILDLGYVHGSNEIGQNNYGTEITAKAKANTISMGWRYERALEMRSGGTVLPYLGFRYVHLDSDDFGNDLGMQFAADKRNLYLPHLGISWTMRDWLQNDDVNRGRVYPAVDVGYVWNLGDRSAGQTVRFGNGANSFDCDITDSGSFYGKLGLEYVRNNMTLGLGYKYQKSSSVESNKWNLDFALFFN